MAGVNLTVAIIADWRLSDSVVTVPAMTVGAGAIFDGDADAAGALSRASCVAHLRFNPGGASAGTDLLVLTNLCDGGL